MNESPEPAEPAKAKRKVWRLLWPVLAWVLFLAWSNIPPYRMHINKVRRGDHIFAWHWRLWEQGGRGYCDVRYYDHNNDDAPIERWALFGYDSPNDMPDELARTKKDQLRSAYKKVCSAMREAGDPDPDVRVFVRCGGKLGWDQVAKRKSNACKLKAKSRKSKRKKRRRK